MYIPIQQRNATPNPAPDQAWLFLDSDNGNALTIKYGCPACQYIVVNGSISATHVGDCDCACDLAKEVIEAASCALEKGLITPEQYQSIVGNVNFHVSSIPNQITGQCNNSVTSEAPLIITVATRTNVSCFGAEDGQATFNITGGVGPYTVTLNGGADPSALAPGSYVATVTDSEGRTASVSFIINGSTVALSSIVGLIVGDSVNVAPQGGTGPYAIAWTGPEGFISTDFTINMPVEGDYDFEITDAYGCKISGTVSYGG